MLFEVSGKKALFPGDAQIENWNYALSGDDRALLSDVNLYKVGHHGSTNATPKSLWNLFRNRSASNGAQGRIKSLLSTMAGRYARSGGMEVPRTKLVSALQKETDLFDTRDIECTAEKFLGSR